MSRCLRYVRILWTVFCGIATVLLIALWVRSYWFNDVVGAGKGTSGVYLESILGRIEIGTDPDTESFSEKIDNHESSLLHAVYGGENPFGLKMIDDNLCNHYSIQLPHLYFVTFFATLAIAPWIRWRFTLRTLLIATTLIAVVLGLIVWAGR